MELTMCGTRSVILMFVEGGAYSNYCPTLPSFYHATIAYFWTLFIV